LAQFIDIMIGNNGSIFTCIWLSDRLYFTDNDGLLMLINDAVTGSVGKFSIEAVLNALFVGF